MTTTIFAAPQIVTQRLMTAHFNGKCFQCGGKIEVGESIVFFPQRVVPPQGERPGKARHAQCEVKPVEQKEEKKSSVYKELEQMGSLPALPDGYYTVIFEDGEHRSHKVTLRFRTQRTGEWMEGRQLVARYIGGDNESVDSYVRFAFCDGRKLTPWKSKEQFSHYAILGAEFLLRSESGYQQAGLLYCKESGRCCMCNHLLTNEESIEAGIGPVCRKRLGL